MTFRQLRYIILISIVVLGYLVSWSYLKSDVPANPMIGTWVMKSGVYLGPDGKPGDLAPGSTKQMKVINQTHFTTIWEDTIYESNKGYNGGAYTYKDGIYTEYLEYFTITDMVGDTAHFKIEIQDEELNISACDARGNISKTGYFQVWTRVH